MDELDLRRVDGPEGLETRRMRAALSSRLFGLDRDPVRIDRFEVIECLGRGGMGTVYLAHDPSLDRRIALKVLHASHTDSAELAARLREEARLMARLKHPHVATIHEVVEVEGQVALAMEYVEGGTLQAWCRAHTERSRVRAEQVLQWAVEAARGLVAAHAVGLVHRDLKPANMLIGADGRLRIADFGLARLRGETDDAARSDAMTLDGASTPSQTSHSIAGTPAYMAPEQLEGHADERTDIYAWCLSFHEALYGELPFAGMSTRDRLANARADRVVLPRDVRGVPKWAQPLLARGVAADPNRRWPSMSVVLDELERRRRARWRLPAVGGAVLGGGLVLAGARLLGNEPTTIPCDDGAAALEEAWGSQRRTQIAAAFAGHGSRAMDEALPRVEDRMQSFVAGWKDAKLEACRMQREGTTEAHRLTQACLDGTRAHFSTFSEQIARGDGETLRQAVVASLALPSPDTCLRQSPNDLPTAAHLEAGPVLDQVGRARALRGLSRLDEARTAAEDALRLASQGSVPSLTAAAHGELSSAAFAAGAYADARAHAEAALMAAERGGTANAIARAWVQLAAVLVELDRLEDAAFAGVRAESFAVRAGSPPVLVADILYHQGQRLHRQGELRLALETHRRAYDTHRTEIGEETNSALQHLMAIGLLLTTTGDLEGALETSKKVVELTERLIGPNHAQLGGRLYNLARVQLKAGEREAAISSFRRAAAIADDNPWYRPEQRARLSLGLAEAYGAADAERSRAELERAIAIAENAATRDPRIAWMARTGLGHLAFDERDYARAAEVLGALLQGDREPEGMTPINRSILRQKWAVARAHLGEHDEAIRQNDLAMEELRASVEETSVWMGEGHERHGQVLAAVGHLASALAAYDRASAIYDAAGNASASARVEQLRVAALER